MPKYTVLVREVHVSHMVVEADSPKEAIKKIKDGDGDEALCEYSHTLDSETWSVDDAEGNETRKQYPNGIPGIPGS